MAKTKKIIISLPKNLLEEVDNIVSIEENRNEFIQEAMNLYVQERKKIQIKESMRKGYLEMSKINIALSELGLSEDIRELSVYESTLMGCEK